MQADTIKRIRAMCNLMICELKMWPSSPSNECTAHRVCPKEPRLAINNAYRSCLGQCRLVTQRGKLFGLDALCTPCQPLIIDQFWFITLPQSVMGRSDCSIIKTHILVPPPFPIFQNIFLDLVPPSKKITNANTNTKIISDDKRRQKRWLAYFSSRDDYKSDTLLTAC